MNDLLGTIIPLLMSGNAGIVDILRAIGGADNGASGTDGLAAMLSSQAMNARMYSRTNDMRKAEEIRLGQSIDFALDRFGVNPYSAGGQSAAKSLGALYKYMPDMMGAALGVPNRSTFDAIIANGSSAISRAAGYGLVDMTNPYSILNADRRARTLGNMAYDLAVREKGGYDIEFGHGLNMKEIGKVTQRLLSSEIPYLQYGKDGKTETGNVIDPTEDPKEFKDNLKRLGSKFNEAASMLSKVTGSVEEALNVMDRLGGGNFLGGTAEQALAIASKARKMATAIRVTSAAAGVDPKQMYASMLGSQNAIASGMGINMNLASSAGFGNVLMDMSSIGTMGYLGWASVNPQATEQQKQAALFAANARVSSYAGATGSAFAAAIADNKSMFSDSERKRILDALRKGRPEDVAGMVKRRIGSSRYDMYMTEESAKIAAQERAKRENPDFFDELNQASIEGNLDQADNYGSNRLIKKTLHDLDTFVTEATGTKGFIGRIDKSAAASLRKMALEQGIPKDVVEKMDSDDLKRFLKARPGANAEEIDRAEQAAKVDAAGEELSAMRMSAEDLRESRETLMNKIRGSVAWKGTSKQDEMLEKLRKANSEKELLDVYHEYSDGMRARDFSEFKNLRKDVFKGKITEEEYNRWNVERDRMRKSLRTDFTADERIDEAGENAKRSRFERMATLKGSVADLSKMKYVSDAEAVNVFSGKVRDLAKNGDISVSDEELEGAYRGATLDIVSEVIGDSIGDVSDKDALRHFKEDFAWKVEEHRKSGKSLTESWREATEWAIKERPYIGEKGRDTLRKWSEESNDDDSEFVKTYLNREKWLSAATGRIDSNATSKLESALSDMKYFAGERSGNITDFERIGKFASAAKDAGLHSGDEKKFKEMKVAGISKLLSDAGLKIDGEKLNGLAEKASNLVDSESGRVGYGEAIKRVLEEAAGKAGIGEDEKSALSSAAEKIASGDDIGRKVIGNVLGQMQGKGRRVNSFNSMIAGNTGNQALMILAAANAKAMGMDIRKLGLGKEWEPLVSSLDDIQADKSSNAFSNAMAVGGASFRNEAIKGAEDKIAELRGKLSKDFDEKKIVSALTGTDDASKKLRQDLEKKLGEGGRTDDQVKGDIKFLKSLSENKIGGKSGLGVMLSAEDFAKVRSGDAKKTSDEDLVNVTKSANREDSTLYDVVAKLSEFVGKLAPFFSNPSQVFNVHVESWE